MFRAEHYRKTLYAWITILNYNFTSMYHKLNTNIYIGPSMIISYLNCIFLHVFLSNISMLCFVSDKELSIIVLTEKYKLATRCNIIELCCAPFVSLNIDNSEAHLYLSFISNGISRYSLAWEGRSSVLYLIFTHILGGFWKLIWC
jgi:hypothetical protein